MDVVPPEIMFGPVHEYVSPELELADKVTLVAPHGIDVFAITVGVGATVVPETEITTVFVQPDTASVTLTV